MKYLEENFTKYPVRLFPKHGAEDHRDSIMTSFDVYGLFLPVMYGTDFAALSNSLRSLLDRKSVV